MDIFVARQPILDRREKVFAYELLFRSGPENVFSHADPNEATGRLIDHSMLGFGLDTLIGAGKAFINIPREFLLRNLVSILPRERAVVEILETVEPDDEVVSACRGLKDAGYLLALDDFAYHPRFEPLLSLADIVKVDFRASGPAERGEYAQRFAKRGIAMLAEKVETREDFRQGLDLGYSMFQGYYFCKPEMIAGKRIPAYKMNYLLFLREVQRPELDYGKLDEVIRQEVSLSVKLLKFLNSAYFGLRTQVTSIRHALALLGEQQIRRWATLIVIAGLGDDKPAELAKLCLIRAQFCESLGTRIRGQKQELDLFLTGLLSGVDALMDRPMEDLLKEIAISEPIQQALLRGEGPLGVPYRLVREYERGEWERVSDDARTLRIDEKAIPGMYARAVEWAESILAG